MTTPSHHPARKLRLAIAAAAVSALAVALPASWAQTGSGSGATSGGSTAAGGSASSDRTAAKRSDANGSLAREDSRMLADLAHANIAEIETGKLALEKSQNDQVKKFAQQMIDDHGAALKEMQTLAQSKGMTMPDGTDMKHKAVATALRVLTGDTFDRQYVSRAGVNAHQDTLKLLQKAQKEGKDADVKALAAKMIPAVQRHLDMARQMASKMDKGSSNAGAAGGRSGTSGTSGGTGNSGSGSGGSSNSSNSSGSSR